jgi:hypothetical protein
MLKLDTETGLNPLFLPSVTNAILLLTGVLELSLFFNQPAIKMIIANIFGY